MDQGQTDVALRATEVPMLEPEIVRQIRGLAAMSWGSKRIAATLGISRGAARRYLRGATPGAQERPRARRLDADQRTVAVALLDGEAAGNAVVARQLLGERGIDVELRTLQGSRLLATYDSMVGFGQERVLVCWNRLIRPDGASIGLQCMPGVDLSGYAGFADDVDHHWWRILSGVAVGTLLSATAQRSQGDVSGFQPTFPQIWASNAAGSINSAGQQVTQKNLQIQPTIRIRPGFTVNVLVTKDIVISPFVRARDGR